MVFNNNHQEFNGLLLNTHWTVAQKTSATCKQSVNMVLGHYHKLTCMSIFIIMTLQDIEHILNLPV